jgi:hypothetical protein
MECWLFHERNECERLHDSSSHTSENKAKNLNREPKLWKVPKQFLRSQVESKDAKFLVIFNIQITKCGIIQTGFRSVTTTESAENPALCSIIWPRSFVRNTIYNSHRDDVVA